MNPKLAILDAKLVDGTGSDPILTSAVLIGQDGSILAAGPRDSVTIPKATPTLQASGMTLLPGLIDGHVHLAWDKSLYSPHQIGLHLVSVLGSDRQLVRAGHYAQMALAAGVTTVRDCGADDFSILALRDMIDAGGFVGPRILASGRPITTTGGHLYTDWGVDTVDEMKKAVRLLASKGVDFIKIILSGGTTTPGTNITRAHYSRQELQTAADEAHCLGLQVVVHAISTDSIRLAAEVGVDTIEHCSWIGKSPRTITTDERAVDFMVENRVCVDHAIIPRPYLFPDEYSQAPTSEEGWWLDMLKVRWPFLHAMRERGVTVFLGTDAAFGPWPGTGLWSGFEEIARAVEIMVRWAKFTPLETIAMVTGEAAKALCLDQQVGTIEKGKKADLVLLERDPLTDIRALRQANMVFQNGNLVARQGMLVLGGAKATGESLRGWGLPA